MVGSQGIGEKDGGGWICEGSLLSNYKIWATLQPLRSYGEALRGMVTRSDPCFRKASGGHEENACPGAMTGGPSLLHWDSQEKINAVSWDEGNQPRGRGDNTHVLVRYVWWGSERNYGRIGTLSQWSRQEQIGTQEGEREVWRKFSRVLIWLNAWLIPAALAFYWLLKTSKP